MKRIISILCCTITLTACTQPITYVPIVDIKKVDQNAFAADLKECHAYAQKIEDDTALEGITMAIIGAAAGAAIGNQYGMAGHGATYGGIVGATYGTADGGIKYRTGTEQVIRNCLIGRGYKVLGKQ